MEHGTSLEGQHGVLLIDGYETRRPFRIAPEHQTPQVVPGTNPLAVGRKADRVEGAGLTGAVFRQIVAGLELQQAVGVVHRVDRERFARHRQRLAVPAEIEVPNRPIRGYQREGLGRFQIDKAYPAVHLADDPEPGWEIDGAQDGSPLEGQLV